MFGSGLLQPFRRAAMTGSAMLRTQGIEIDNLKRRVRFMALATIGIGLFVQMRSMTFLTGKKLAMLQVTVFTIQHAVIARVIKQFTRLL